MIKKGLGLVGALFLERPFKLLEKRHQNPYYVHETYQKLSDLLKSPEKTPMVELSPEINDLGPKILGTQRRTCPLGYYV